MVQLVHYVDINQLNERAVKYIVDSYLLYYDSIESYYSRKEPTLRRKIRYYLTFVLLVIFNIKYVLLTLYPDKVLLTPLIDWTIMFNDQARPIHAFSLSLGLVTISGKLIVFYYERRKNIKFLDIIYDMRADKPIYKLSMIHYKKLSVRSTLLYYLYIKYAGTFIEVIGDMCVIITTYLYLDYDNVVILFLWTLIIIFVVHHARISITFGTYFFYLPITMLNYRFDELIMNLKVAIRWNNEKGLNKILESYNELIGCRPTTQWSLQYDHRSGLLSRSLFDCH